MNDTLAHIFNVALTKIKLETYNYEGEHVLETNKQKNSKDKIILKTLDSLFLRSITFSEK